MNKLIAFALLAFAFGITHSHAQSVDSRAANNAFKKLTQAECVADKGAAWKPSETWTRKQDGKERVTQARCAFDPKSAKAIIAKQLAAR